MKFYIVNSEGSFFTEKGTTVHPEEAKQFSLKEAKDVFLGRDEVYLEYFTNKEVYVSMIPVPTTKEKATPKKPEAKYLLYCFERSRFWLPNQQGYTDDAAKAGRYSKKEAEDICKQANFHSIEEAMIPDQEGLNIPRDCVVKTLHNGEVRYYLTPNGGLTMYKRNAYKYSRKGAEEVSFADPDATIINIGEDYE